MDWMCVKSMKKPEVVVTCMSTILKKCIRKGKKKDVCEREAKIVSCMEEWNPH